MKNRTLLTALTVAAQLLFCYSPHALAQVPSIIGYQGRVSSSGTNFTGIGYFKFTLVDPGTTTAGIRATASASVVSGFLVGITVVNGGSGYTSAPSVTITDTTGAGATATATISGGTVTAITVQNAGQGYSATPTISIAAPPSSFSYGTFWSNDGTSADGYEPANAVAWPVSQGLFHLLLGDTGIANMVAIPPAVFTNSDVRLRIWFDDGVHGFSQLSPDQRMAASGYALMAANIPDALVDSTKLADGAVTAAKLAANAVQGGMVASGAIGTAQLAAAAVTGSKIAANTIDITKLSFTPLTAETDPKVAVTASNAIPRWNGTALVNGTLFDNGNGGIAINGTTVIDMLGRWMGSPTGLQGPQGAQGSVGPTGPNGDKGDTGTQGVAGPAGPAGAQGAIGAQGPPGPKGLNWLGVWSSSTSYAANDAVEYNGSAWVALQPNTNVTPSAGPNWSLLASKGDTGPQGSQGPAGPTGPKGDKGDTGSQGVVGPAGATGATGPQGPQGPQGPAGPAVHTSAICASGSTTSSGDCSCSVRLISKVLARDCSVTSDTGSCSGSGSPTYYAACCVCAPN